jgi:hypothetical protein
VFKHHDCCKFFNELVRAKSAPRRLAEIFIFLQLAASNNQKYENRHSHMFRFERSTKTLSQPDFGLIEFFLRGPQIPPGSD